MILAAGAAAAQTVGQSAGYGGDLSAFHGGSRSLLGMLSTVQGATGAKVVEIRFSDRQGAPGYDVVLLRGKDVTFMHMDEKGGDQLQIESASAPTWMLKWRQRRVLTLDRKAHVPLAQAIAVAQDAYPSSPAVAAGLAWASANPQNAVSAYNVLLDDHGRARRVAVDSTTGQIIADPQALGAWP
jgi:uncharacterized membrane protein YkoI